MCMAIYKPKGAELPADDILLRCWTDNPDGGGYCTAENGIVRGSKGFMTFPLFLEILKTDVKTDMPALIHFRLATHGATNGAATHPFPLSKNENELNALAWKSDCGIVHNGIVPGYGDKINGKISDTQHYIRDFLALGPIKKMLQTDKVQNLVKDMSMSKWAFLYGTGETVLIGTWINDNGIWYSNSGYLWSIWNDKETEETETGLYEDDPCPLCGSEETWIAETKDFDYIEICAQCGTCRICETDPCVCSTIENADIPENDYWDSTNSFLL